MAKKINKEITALQVNQWLADWDKVPFDKKSFRAKPNPYFYIFSLSAAQLRALSGIYRRTRTHGKSSSQSLGIQRRHDKARSNEISKFIQYGFPWSELSQAKRDSGEYNDLQKPGWLPTAIVVNILKEKDCRNGASVHKDDLITITEDSNGHTKIVLPSSYNGPSWEPKARPPIEVIDGQHRLWAFDEDHIDLGFELPVVAFYGLDISWQAYLFWTINIKPKRINASLAYDLYPLLRTEDWLEKLEGHPIYRETRSQELVEILWSSTESPWRERINMLGESGYSNLMVSQAAWIRSLMATFVKSWSGRGTKRLGGLFGSPAGSHEQVIPWSLSQQAAFIILVGQKLEESIKSSKEKWAKSARDNEPKQPSLFDAKKDYAFYGPNNLLNTDQGIRGLLQIVNDLFYLRAEELNLDSWLIEDDIPEDKQKAVSSAIKSLKRQKVIIDFISELTQILASYDWRSSSAAGLSEEERMYKAAFRGSGGYKELRMQLLQHVAKGNGRVNKVAKELEGILGL